MDFDTTVPLHLPRSEGSDMRTPDIAEAIGPDVFTGRPESLAIGPIDRNCAVITYPKTKGEKAAPRSGGLGGESAIGAEVPDPHRQVLATRRLHPGEAQVALLVLSHGRHLDRHARTRINHALFDQSRLGSSALAVDGKSR